MGFRFHYVGLACWALLAAGCATVTPCIQMPADGKPVVVNFGDDLTMRIDGFRVYDDSSRPVRVYGVVQNHADRGWRDLRLEAQLDFHPIREAETPDTTAVGGKKRREIDAEIARFWGQPTHHHPSPAKLAATGTPGPAVLKVTASQELLDTKEGWMETGTLCEATPSSCPWYRNPVGPRVTMEMKYSVPREMRDGICRRLVEVQSARRLSGTYSVGFWLLLLSPKVGDGIPAESASGQRPEGNRAGSGHSNDRDRGRYQGSYEDELVFVKAGFGGDKLHLFLQNLSDQALLVNWKRLVWVNFEGYAVQLERASTPIPSSFPAAPDLIPAGAKVKVTLVQDEGQKLPGGGRGASRPLPFIPAGPNGETILDQTFGLHLPITIGDKPHPLELRFRIKALLPMRLKASRK